MKEDLQIHMVHNDKIKNVIRTILREIDFSNGQMKGYTVKLCWIACKIEQLVGRGKKMEKRYFAQWVQLIATQELGLVMFRPHQQNPHFITAKGHLARVIRQRGNLERAYARWR